jgi:hypothetical protein
VILSPVLQCCLGNTQAASAPSAPVFNITIGKEIADIFQPPLALQAPVPGSVLLPSYVSIADNNTSNLLSHLHAPGPDMPLTELCEHYNLGSNILNKLTKIFYKDV